MGYEILSAPAVLPDIDEIVEWISAMVMLDSVIYEKVAICVPCSE